MNYAGGKFEADVLGSHSSGYVNVESVLHQGHADTITITDAHLLFTGDFKRSGLNLILSKNGHELVVEDYFRGEKRAALASPDGAHLTGDIVNALTGHVEYAQAAGAPDAAKVIGHVTKLTGSATAIRNGVSIVLNMGDNVHKGDVVQSGSDSQLSITFIDGTVFGLSSSARMVLNEMVYDPNGTGNSSLLSLVQGTITFVAGETAKHGDMKIETPVAIMGIRGTAVLVEIGFEVPVTDPNNPAPTPTPVKFQVLQEPDGTVGSYVLYAKNDLTYSNPIATINRAGEVTSYSANGNLSVAQVTQLAPEAKAIIDQTLQTYFPNYTPAVDNKPNNANPQTPNAPSGSTPANPVPSPAQPDKVPLNPVGTPTPAPINLIVPAPTTDNPDATKVIQAQVTIVPLNTAPTIDVTPVVDKATFKIPDQVKITDPDISNPAFNDVAVPYVAGSGKILSAVGPAYTPTGLDLTSLVNVDQATGAVSYDSTSFAFLKAGDKVVVTIGFDSKSGPDTVPETLTLTIDGVNDAPAITAASLTLAEGGTVPVTTANFGVIDPDNTSFTFTVTNVTHGTFQTTADGSKWVDATTFTTADLVAGHVRFVHDGGLIAPTFSIQADDGETLNNLSNVFAGSINFNPVAGAILGDAGENTLVGTPGNDVFQGFGGNDILEGGGGRDKAIYTDATDGITVNLAAGTVQGTAPGDLASIGTDTLQSIEYIVGSNFADTFDATGFSNTSANAGSVPTAGRFSGSITNFFEGGGGDDTIIGNGATMVSYDHAAAAVTVDLAAGTGHGTVAGDAARVGNDTFSGVTGVRGSAFDDTLSGNNDPKGVDVFYGGAGNDFIDGRAGYDLVVYAPLIDNTVTGGITVNMAAGTVVGDASVGSDTLRSVEAIRGTNFNDIYNAVGFSGSSTNAGSLGTFNQFEGMGGNDTITGNGNTTVEYSNALAGVTVDIAAHTAHSTAVGDAAGIGVDTFSGVNGIRGSEYDDILSGSNNPFGTTENFTGGGGNDTIDGRGGFDRAIYSSTFMDRGTGGITINMAAGTVVGDASVGSDTLLSIEAIRGTNFNDAYDATGFSGTSTNAGSFGTFNEFEGMGGDDTITGNGNTRIAFYNASAGVTVDLVAGTAQDTADYLAQTTNDLAGVGKDTITGGVNAVTGSAFADNITGDGAANILNGGGGNDTIDGGGGTDLAVFSGPMAAYTISFNTPSAGQIQVADSVSGRDGTDTLSNIEALQFTNGTVLVSSGTSASPINLAALTQGIALNAVTTLTGNADDFVVVNPGMNGLPINLGDGSGDTIILASADFYSLNLANVENVTGTSGDDGINLQNNANGLAVDLGAGNNTLNLANGSNTLSVTNVQNINGTDFSGTPSNDTLTLLNDVNGVSINLAQGANTLNLAAGNNSLTNAFGVTQIHGSSSADSLTLANAFNITVDLGDGTDTVTVTAGTGFFPTLSLLNVENLAGTSDNNFITLLNNVNGLSVDPGAGNDTLELANGSNSVSVTNVENISASDFAAGSPSNDTLTLLNNVTGVSVNLDSGVNTLNLHAGINSLDVFNVQSINGSTSGDTLTLGQVSNLTGVTRIDLGSGNDTLNLGVNASNVTFVYADNDGADVISGFNGNNGDKIDLTGVSGVHSLADLQISPSGTDTIITFSPGNTLTLTGVAPGSLLNSDFVFTPAVTSVVATGSGIDGSGNGDLSAGHLVTLTVNMSEAVTVAGGIPTLTLNDGGTATYQSGSGSSALVFTYTVAAGQNTADLTITTFNANSATITDGAGNTAIMTGAVTNPAGTLQIDTTAPTVSSVVATGSGIDGSGNGDLNAGHVVTLTVNVSEVVTVAGGIPTLTLNDGGTATYQSGSGTGALVFTYSVAAGQNTADLTVTTFNANSATITDGAGNAVTMTGVVTNPAGTLQIDTVAPAEALAITAIASDSGTVGDFITNDTTLTVSGTNGALGASEKIQVSSNGGTTWTDVVQNTGTTWSLVDGTTHSTSFTYQARIVDTAGNIGTTASQAVTIDTTAPAVSIAGFTPDSGVIGDGITNATTVTVSGTAEIGSLVTLYDGANSIGTTTADGSGNWSISESGLTNGSTHNFTATATDQANNTSAPTAALSVTIDTGGPAEALAITAIATDNGTVGDFITNDTTLIVSGSNGTLGAGEKIQVSSDGSTWHDVTQTTSTTWSYDDTATVHSTSFSYQARIVDTAGNIGTTASQAITIDTGGPAEALAITAIASDSGTVGDFITNDTTLIVSGSNGTLGAGEKIQVSSNGGASWTDVAQTTANTWSFDDTATVHSTSFSYQARIVDTAGNIGTTASQAITIDTGGPAEALAITAIATDSAIGGTNNDFITNDTTLIVSGSNGTLGAGEKIQVSSNGGASWTDVAQTTANTWSYDDTATVHSTSFSYQARIVDTAGNIGTTASQAITIDTSAPVAPTGLTLDPTTDSGTVGDNKTNVLAVKIDGAAEAGSTVTLYDTDGSTVIGTGTANATGAFSITTSSLSAGTHTITAKATDAAGNTGAASASLAVTIDTSVPTETLAITVIAGGSSPTDTTITVSGSNGALATGDKIQISTDGANWTDVVQNTATTWSFADSTTHTANFTYRTRIVDTAANVGAIATQDVLVAFNGGTLSVAGSSAFVAEFTGTGGNLQLGPSPGITGTVNAISVAGGPVVIGGSGSVTSGTGDAIDLTATGGTQAIPANLTVNPTGPITGAASGIMAVQNASGSITITASGPVIGQAGRGIFAQQSTTGVGSILINGSGNVTGTGSGYSGIVAQNLNTANSGDVTVSQTGNISGGHDGIRAQSNGNGNVTVTTGANANITANLLYGIEAVSNGQGNIVVTIASGDVITSGSVGINAYNQATSIPQGAASSILVTTASGSTIDSGSFLTGSSSRPAGILAGYKGGTTTTPNSAVFGNVVVNNSAHINAAGGDGIRAYTFGSGNVAVHDLAGAIIVAKDEFGISASTNGIGNVSVSTVAGDIITSGSSGISATNSATAIAAAAASSVSVTAWGTINSGTHLTPGGSQPQGISAGYFANVGAPNANVNGTVAVDNFANITAAAGWGINAYNYGNGSVTLTDEPNTTVSGAQYGIAAYSSSSGSSSSGSVTINVGTGATISAGALYGLAGIAASENNAGNISITTSIGDIISSGGTGISAGNQATNASSSSQISITAAGTINSGFDMSTGGGQPGGIWAGYTPGGIGTVNANVAGNVVVDSAAIINAAAGIGIGLYNWGVGNITAALELSSLIAAPTTGLNVYAQGGGNVSITNHGAVTVASGVGISAGTGTSVSGVVSINNSGTISSLGSAYSPVIQINNGSTQAATFTNTGTVTANLPTRMGSSVAVADYNGSIVINNTGTISGNVALGTATFNNNIGGVWNVGGSNFFGNGADAINNAGTINISGVTKFNAGGTLTLNNSGSVNVLANSAAYIGGAVSTPVLSSGSFLIGDRSELEFANSVAAGQTVSFFDGNGLLTLDNPSTFFGTISGLAIGDAIDFLGISVAGATISPDGSTLTVTENFSPQILTYNLAGAPAGAVFDVLSGNEIILVPTSATQITGLSSTPYSDSSLTAKFYIFSYDTISGPGIGLNIATSDNNSTHYSSVVINQTSSVSASGNAVNLTTSGANIALISAGTITSSGGVGIFANSGNGSVDIIDYGNVSGNQFGIDVHTSGLGPLNIVVGGAATITGTTSYGILAISTAGVLDVSTLPGVFINSGSVGIFAENQGSLVPLGNHSSISVSTSGTINSGSTGILAGYLPGAIAAPNSAVVGNVNVNNAANINAATGVGISAFNYGVGDVSVSTNSGTTITATAAGPTYGIAAFNYGSGNTTVTTGFGSTINSGGAGIQISNQASGSQANPVSAGPVTVVALGAINSGANANNSGGAPSGIQAGINPGLASVFNANVAGNVLVNDSGNIVAAAGEGIEAYNYGVGNIEVNLGFGASITANGTTTGSGRAPYGIGAFNYGPGDISVTTSGGDVITSNSSGINASNQSSSITADQGALVTVLAAGSIHSGTINNNSGSSPSGITAGFLGGTNATQNLNVNGTIIVNNAANITADAGVGINAYNYGNGDITVNDASGTTVSGALYGIEAHAEAVGGTGNIAVNVYSNATINSTASYGIFVYSNDIGNISVITGSGDVINAGSVGIDAVNVAATIPASANSSIVVTAYGTINSGTAVTGTGNPPGGIVAGYLGGNVNPTTFPLTSINGEVVVNNFANITAAAGDGIRAFTYGVGDVTVNDFAGTITALGGASPTNGFGIGIVATNQGSGDIHISTAAGTVINSGSSGIVAVNKAPSSGSFVVPSTSEISVLAFGTIHSGTIPTGTVVIDTLSSTGPSVIESLANDTGASASDRITSNDTLTGAGLANTVVHFTVDGSAIAATATSNAQGVWSFTPSGLADGAHTIVASQTDSFGNTGTASLSFTLDTAAPVVTITSAGAPTNQVSQTITGTVDVADAGGTVTILDGAIAIGTALVQSGGSWSSSVALANGSNPLTARVTDAAGNVGTSGVVIDTLSTTGPSVIESLASDTGASASDRITSNDTLTGAGLANTVVHFAVDGSAIAATATSNAQGVWSFTPTGLADGPHTIVASQTDSFGNTGTASLSFTLDTTAPVVTITSAGGPTNQAVQTIAGTVDVADAGATVTILDGTTAIGTALVQGDGSWSSSVALANGSNSLTARVTDTAGNAGTSGDPAAGILAGYNPNNSDTPDNNVHGNVSIDDYASILAPARTDGIRGVNYGTGTITIIAEAGATISAGRYGIGAFGYDGGDVSVTNYATVTGATAAIDATTTSTGTVSIDNYGIIVGNVVSGSVTFHNELGALWNLAGSSTFATGTNVLINDATINTTGTSSITTSGVLSISNAGTVNVQSGSLDVSAAVTGTGSFTISNGATLEFGSSVAAGETVSFLGANGTIKFDHSLTAPFVGQISNLNGTALNYDNIDLADLVWNPAASAQYQAAIVNGLTTANGILTVSDSNGHAEVFNLVNYTGSGHFMVQNDGHGGTIAFDNQAPSIAGDMSVVAVKGGGITLTTADLSAVDPVSSTQQLVYTVLGMSHGHLEKLGNNPATPTLLGVNDTFTLQDIQSSLISFVTDDASYVGPGSFTLSLSDGVPGVATSTARVGVSIVDAQLSVLTTGGYNFEQDNSLGAMGSGAIVAGYTDATFTIANANVNANRDFIFSGTGFAITGSLGNLHVTGGTITSILEVTHDTQTPLLRFDFNVSAANWMNAVIAMATKGDQSLLEALTSAWTFNFIGNTGADAFGASDFNDVFNGKGGNDTLDGQFGYDRANYGGATGPINVQLAAGIVTGDASVGTDTLKSIEMVTGSNYADTFDATGFSATSTNAGSTVTSNFTGMFNEFEGGGGNDTIIGNGQTRISYFHATAGVTVTFNPAMSWATASSGVSGTATGDSSVGTDTFTGVNQVRGSFFNDTFTGSNNPSGTTENFEGLGGNDTINGGGGFDRAIYSQASDNTGIIVNLAAGTVTGGPDTGTDTLISVEAIYGTNFADTYDATGFTSSSTNAGSAGVNGNGAAFNEFEGGGGNDIITGNGNTRVAFYHATGGVVVTLGANGSGTADGNASVGHDIFNPGPVGVGSVNAVRGSEFNDIITGNGGNNTLEGQGGNDVLSGNGGNDTLTGGTGSDIFVFKVGVTDFNSPLSNNDTITDFSHSDGDRIDLRSISSITSLSDVLLHATQVGPNTVIDFSYLNPSDPTSLTLQNVTKNNLKASDFSFASPAGPSIAVTVQTPDGYDFSTLYDDMAASSLATSANTTDHIFAVDAAKGITFELIGSGFTYSGGNVTGGTITEIDVLNTTDPTQTTQDHVLVNTNGWNINAAAFFGDISQYGSLVPSTHAAGLAALNGIFNEATYSIVGSSGGGNSNGQSHAGADVFFGGDHADVFNGMPGPFGPNDHGSDTVDYSHAPAVSGLTGITVDLSNPLNNTGAAAGDTFISIENLRGSNFNDTLTGDGNNNVIEGGLGNDTLNGGAGDTVSYEHATDYVTVDLTNTGPQDTHSAGFDTLSNFSILRGSSHDDFLTGGGSSVIEGDAGNDQITGVGGNVTASYEHASSGVTVSLNVVGVQNTGGAGSDTLTNIANLFGSQFSDNLTGNDNANRLDGGYGGSDVHDTLTGLGGADTFVFNTGHVTITDFSELQADQVDISHAHNGTGFTDAELNALLAASTGDTIDFGNNNLLTFTGITNVSAQLHAGDFLH